MGMLEGIHYDTLTEVVVHLGMTLMLVSGFGAPMTPEHIEISAALQSAIHPGRDTDIASVQRVWDAHKRVYREFGHEDWLDLVWEVYFQHLPDLAR
jgi:hypothetical protein